MELRHLRTLLVLAEELHFGRTAQRLRIAQSAVSQTVKAVEQEIGTTLFARTRRQVGLTTAGKHFLEHAASALRELEHASTAARKAANGETGRLMLRFTLMSALTVLPRVVARFQRECPSVQLSIASGGTTEQLAAINSGHCDIGFMPIKRQSLSPLESEVVERAALRVLVPSAHRLSGRKHVELRELAGEKFVFLAEASEPQIRLRFLRRCLAAGFEPNVILEVEQLDVLLAFVSAGVGISCAPGFATRAAYAHVTAVPLLPEVIGGISAVWNPNALPASGQRFLAILREERDHPGSQAPRARGGKRGAPRAPAARSRALARKRAQASSH